MKKREREREKGKHDLECDSRIRSLWDFSKLFQVERSLNFVLAMQLMWLWTTAQGIAFVELDLFLFVFFRFSLFLFFFIYSLLQYYSLSPNSTYSNLFKMSQRPKATRHGTSEIEIPTTLTKKQFQQVFPVRLLLPPRVFFNSIARTDQIFYLFIQLYDRWKTWLKMMVILTLLGMHCIHCSYERERKKEREEWEFYIE